VRPVSAVIIAQDEERNLPDALRSVAFCDEVVVVDAGSTDRTREVAREAGARVIVNSPWPGFVEQRNVAVDAASHDWVLAVDADERVSPALRDEIAALRSAGYHHSGYRVPRVAFYMGRWLRGTDWYPDPQLRLFDRRQGRWQGALVHESVVVRGSVGRLRSDLEHHPYEDIGDHMRSIDRYTTLWARQAYAAGRRAGPVEGLASASWAFLRNYVLKGGVLQGQAGLAVSILNSYYTYAKLAKLHELALAGGAAR